MNENICKYISYNEATRSSTAINNGIDNTPTENELKCMQAVGTKVFDPLREHLGEPIKVESFFRCGELNKLVGGSKNSQHRYGQAIDIDDDFGHMANNEMYYWLANNVEFDQLLWEFGNGKSPDWIHISYNEGNNRNKFSIAYKDNGYTKYVHFYSLSEFKAGLHNIYGSEDVPGTYKVTLTENIVGTKVQKWEVKAINVEEAKSYIHSIEPNDVVYLTENAEVISIDINKI